MIMPKKPCFLHLFQNSSGKSRSSVTLWSSNSSQSSCTSLSRNDCSSAEALTRYSFRSASLGLPLKMLRSNPTVPAFSAARSVSLILGIIVLAILYPYPQNPRVPCGRNVIFDADDIPPSLVDDDLANVRCTALMLSLYNACFCQTRRDNDVSEEVEESHAGVRQST